MVDLVHREVPAVLCPHMAQMVLDLGYQRDPQTGQYLVKMCLTPTKDMFRGFCGKLVPVSMTACRSCNGLVFGPAPANIIELSSCHYRCKICKWVTPGCETKVCRYCMTYRPENLTLMPPAINLDVYGFRVTSPTAP